MSYTLSFALDLGTSGLTLKAALVSANTIHATFRDVTTTFYADGQGGYEFVTAAIPDGFRGVMVFYTGTLSTATDFNGVVIYSRGSVNPEEAENLPVKQTGDSYARIGTAGVGLTNVVLPSGGLSNVTAWTVAITGNLTGNVSGSVGSVTAAVTAGTVSDKTGYALSTAGVTAVQSGLSTYAGGDTSGTATLLTRLSALRAGYLDNLSGGAVALASTALSSAVWTGAKAAFLDDAVTSRMATFSYTAPDNSAVLAAISTLSTHGDSAWSTATGFSTLTAAGVRAAVGMATADLDTQLAAILAASGGGTTPPTASEIAIAVVDQPTAGHTTAGTVGGALVAAGNAGDPWAAILPGSYTGHQAGKILSRLDITPYTAPVATIPAPANGNQTYGYVYTRDGHGALQAACRVTFQMTAGNNADSFSSIQFAALSDADGLLSVLLEKGAAYRARRGSSSEWVAFTAGSGDSFALPAILGTP